MNKLIKSLILIFGCIGQLFAQYIPTQEKYWVLGDSMLLEFNTTGLPFVSSIPTYQSQLRAGSTYLDSITGLLYYSNGSSIWDASGQIMSGCWAPLGSIGGYSSYLVPSSSDPNILYLFLGQGWALGSFFKLKIDKTQNNGLGDVISQDTFEDEFDYDPITYVDYDTGSTGFRIIPHGDGEKYWILSHLSVINQIIPNTTTPTWVKWLVDDDSVSGPFFQDIGLHYGNDLQLNGMAVNEKGTKVVVATWAKRLELFDFDRCTGLLSNNLVLDSGRIFSLSTATNDLLDSGYVSCAFSQTGRFLYVNELDTLFQYDMLANNIANSRLVIWYDTLDKDSINLIFMELGPDNRIYVCTRYLQDYSPTNTRNAYNTWLGIIDKPDLEGLSCDFRRYGLYLDGNGNSYNLPQRYNTQLGVWVGSPCDPNVTGEAPSKDQSIKLKVYPNPANDKFNINWPVQGGYSWALKTIAGVTLTSGMQQTGNATISTATLPEGMYFLEVHSAKEMKVEKVIILSEK